MEGQCLILLAIVSSHCAVPIFKGLLMCIRVLAATAMQCVYILL